MSGHETAPLVSGFHSKGGGVSERVIDGKQKVSLQVVLSPCPKIKFKKKKKKNEKRKVS